MQTGVIRLSPSGAPITNDDGGQAVPGDGMQLRLAEASASTAMAALTNVYQDITGTGATFPGVPIQVLLLNPDPAKKYKVNFHCLIDNLQASAQTGQLRLTASYDGGATFPVVLRETNHQLLADEQSLHACDVGMTLGSLLGFPVTAPIPAGASSIIIRPQARAGVSGNTQIPGANMCIWLSLAELF